MAATLSFHLIAFYLIFQTCQANTNCRAPYQGLTILSSFLLFPFSLGPKYSLRSFTLTFLKVRPNFVEIMTTIGTLNLQRLDSHDAPEVVLNLLRETRTICTQKI